MAGNWTVLNNQPTFKVDTMLLLTDGTVLCHELETPNWHRLKPDANGSYLNGTWDDGGAPAPLPNNPLIPAAKSGPTNAPLYFVSAVLRDGTVFTAGGEYNVQSADADILAVQVYDPIGNAWTTIAPPAGWNAIGDAPSCVLADGRVLVGFINGNTTAIFDPASRTWTAGGAKLDSNSEETFTLLPDGSVLSVQCSNAPGAERYVAANNTWVAAGQTLDPLPQPCAGLVAEIGPAILLPDGRVFAIGASGNTGLYSPVTNSWARGPKLTDAAGATSYPMDAPAALMPNGKVLCVGSPADPCTYPGPMTFFEYDPVANTVSIAPPANNGAGPCYSARLLVLPTGEVLLSTHSAILEIYAPGGAPNAAWKPTITACPTALVSGASYVVSGKQFNGLSQACSYGDDAQMATNYPLVRLQNAAGNVVYQRTSNHSTMAVATGQTVVSTNVAVQAPVGAWQLFVVANGIASDPIAVAVA